MKEFHHKWGGLACRTYTVRELITLLSKYPDDMPVLGTWESTIHGLSDPTVEAYYAGDPAENTNCLIFDVEYDDI